MNKLLKNKIVTVVGGSGFIGRYVVSQLCAKGYQVRVIVRNPDNALYLKTAGDVGQVSILPGNIGNNASLQGKLEHSFAVINLVGILFERGKQTFDALQAGGAGNLAGMAKAAGAKHFIQISALGVDTAGKSNYAKSKLAGEKAVLAAFPEAVIVRPSIVFGAEDNFFNQFATLSCFAPALPLIGGGKTKFQPVYVADVTKAIILLLENTRFNGQVIELGGPQTFSFKAILQFINSTIHRNTRLVNLPFGIASLIGTFAQFLPKPFLTPDQVTLLHYDNVVNPGANTFADLGIQPESVQAIVPHYLQRFARKVA